MFWHHIQTPETREHNGTSYMNAGEIDQVISYVHRIIKDLKVEPMDIGIISPYTYQVNFIKIVNKILTKNRPENCVSACTATIRTSLWTQLSASKARNVA